MIKKSYVEGLINKDQHDRMIKMQQQLTVEKNK